MPDLIELGIQMLEKEQVNDCLQQAINGSYLLQKKTQHARWALVGASPHPLRHLLDGQGQELALAVDVMTSRSRSLGLMADSTHPVTRPLPLPEKEMVEPGQALATLAVEHQKLAGMFRKMIPIMASAKEKECLGLMAERAQAHELASVALRGAIEKLKVDPRMPMEKCGKWAV